MSRVRGHHAGMVTALLGACVWVGGCGGQGAGPAPATAQAPVSPPSVASAPTAPPPIATAAPPVTVAAEPPAGQSAESAEGDEHRHRHHGGVLMLVAMSLKDLDLSPDQRALVDKIRTDLLAAMEPARAAGKDLANTLADGVAAGKVDRAKADAAIGKVVAQMQGLHEASRESLNRLHAALSAQERAALIDKVQSHWEKWKEAHGEDEKDDHQHRSGHLLGLVKTLGLSNDEAQKIKASFRDLMKASPQDRKHKEVTDHLQAFATAFKSEKFDAKTLSGANAANGHIVRWGATRRARFLEAAAPVLTPDQRAQLAQMIREGGAREDV
jgi:Spy/CpxP family protein refolding chaperone